MLRHGRACPVHPRLPAAEKDVDARHKSGHDGDLLLFESNSEDDRLAQNPTPGVIMSWNMPRVYPCGPLQNSEFPMSHVTYRVAAP